MSLKDAQINMFLTIVILTSPNHTYDIFTVFNQTVCNKIVPFVTHLTILLGTLSVSHGNWQTSLKFVGPLAAVAMVKEYSVLEDTFDIKILPSPLLFGLISLVCVSS